MGDVYEYLLGKIAAAGENGQFRTHRHIINLMVALMKTDNMRYFKSGLLSGFDTDQSMLRISYEYDAPRR